MVHTARDVMRKPTNTGSASPTLFVRRLKVEWLKALRPTGTADRALELRACTAGLLVKFMVCVIAAMMLEDQEACCQAKQKHKIWRT